MRTGQSQFTDQESLGKTKTISYLGIYRWFRQVTQVSRLDKRGSLMIQWNLYKADTIGAKKSVRFIDMSALKRFSVR